MIDFFFCFKGVLVIIVPLFRVNMHQVPKVNDVVPKFDSKILITRHAQIPGLMHFGSVPGVWVFKTIK